MLHLLDQVLARLLDTGWTSAPTPAKPSFHFAVPDDTWKTRATATNGTRLNLYLYDVRENCEMRRSSWDQVELPGRTVALSRPPTYYDCHYLVSAWSSIVESDQASPIPDEHEVLSEALRVLVGNPDVNPTALGIAGGGPVFQGAHVYLKVALPDRSFEFNEFWSTMKVPWRLAIVLVMTAPLDLLRDAAPSPLVTTFVQRYGLIGSGTFEERIQIGGWVLRALNDSPIPGARVQRLSTAGQLLDEAQTDAQGRYSLGDLAQGIHRLRALAPGLNALTRNLDVPTAPPSDHIFRLS